MNKDNQNQKPKVVAAADSITTPQPMFSELSNFEEGCIVGGESKEQNKDQERWERYCLSGAGGVRKQLC
ncbi:MAG: hypothetical protein KME55_32255 [Nostoc indistinguendum CM1-VF10]|jgi:hypothetical protein|nr:hypothetical protein [Nostoc indistinguendum CM1-VF10]